MAKAKAILNPELYAAGLDVVKGVIHNAPKPLDMANLLVSRFRDLLDSYSVGITKAARDYLNGHS